MNHNGLHVIDFRASINVLLLRSLFYTATQIFIGNKDIPWHHKATIMKHDRDLLLAQCKKVLVNAEFSHCIKCAMVLGFELGFELGFKLGFDWLYKWSENITNIYWVWGCIHMLIKRQICEKITYFITQRILCHQKFLN